MQRPTAKILHHRRKHAGLLLDTIADPGRRRFMKEVVWMPSHRSLEADATAEQRGDHVGNEMADEAAKGALLRHPECTKEAQAENDYYLKRAKLVAKAIAVAMSLWPARKGRLTRALSDRKNRDMASHSFHEWSFVDGMCRCVSCGSWRRRLPEGKAGGSQICYGWGGRHKVKQATRLGHKLSRAEGDHGLVFCTCCGAFSTRRARKLMRRCTGATTAGRQALRRIERGFVPWQSRRRRQGLLAVRGRQPL